MRSDACYACWCDSHRDIHSMIVHVFQCMYVSMHVFVCLCVQVRHVLHRVCFVVHIDKRGDKEDVGSSVKCCITEETYRQSLPRKDYKQ